MHSAFDHIVFEIFFVETPVKVARHGKMRFLEKKNGPCMQHYRPFSKRLAFSFHFDGILPKMLKRLNFSPTMLSPRNSLSFLSELGGPAQMLGE